ncbi:hypothetical protein GGR20_002918 [Devosia subaequoris]|uniref:Uncharacterized protein n=1 Tax=Devosia subaequoris TaxID=395930 RepID=A0A7W6ND17_9HYPH|nr:hypothetical protein [Devosia subaequoris]
MNSQIAPHQAFVKDVTGRALGRRKPGAYNWVHEIT